MEKIIKDIENFCKKKGINHLFVGGVSFGGLLNQHTTWHIDIKRKIVFLHHHNSLSLLRDDKTIRDIDLIVFSGKQKEELKAFIQKLVQKYNNWNKQFPYISIESPIPDFQKKKSWLQFVSVLEVDNKNNLYFSFGNIKQKISWKSVEPWKVILDDKTSFTVRNPIGDYIGYLVRTPAGIKPKDKKKLIYLQRIFNAVLREGNTMNINYLSQEYFQPWYDFMNQMHQSKNIVIVIKKYVVAIYWLTIGTYFSRTFATLGNQFTGVKQ